MSLIQEFVANPEFLQSQYRKVVILPRKDGQIDLDECKELANLSLFELFPYLKNLKNHFAAEIVHDIEKKIQLFKDDADLNEGNQEFVSGQKIAPDIDVEGVGMGGIFSNDLEKEEEYESAPMLEPGNFSDLFYRHYYVAEALKNLPIEGQNRSETDIFKAISEKSTPEWNAATFEKFSEEFLQIDGSSTFTRLDGPLETRLNRAIEKHGRKMLGFLKKIEYQPETFYDSPEEAMVEILKLFQQVKEISAQPQGSLKKRQLDFVHEQIKDASGYITFLSLILRVADMEDAGYLDSHGNIAHAYNVMQYVEASLGKRLFDEIYETSWHWSMHAGLEWALDDLLDLKQSAVENLQKQIGKLGQEHGNEFSENIQTTRLIQKIQGHLFQISKELENIVTTRPDFEFLDFFASGPSDFYEKIKEFILTSFSGNEDLKEVLLPHILPYISGIDNFLNLPQRDEALKEIQSLLSGFETLGEKRRKTTVRKLKEQLEILKELDYGISYHVREFFENLFEEYEVKSPFKDWPISENTATIEIPKKMAFKPSTNDEESLGSESSEEDMEDDESEEKSSPEPMIPIIEPDEPTEETDESPEFDVDALLKNIEEEKPEEMNVESEEGTEVPFDMDAFLKNIAKPPKEPESESEPEPEPEPAPAFDLDAFLSGVSKSMQALPSLEIRPSEQLKKRGFSTLGLFAAKSYGPGEWIAPFSGKLVTAEEFQKLPVTEKTHAVKVLGKDMYILGVSGDHPDVLKIGAASVANDLDMEYENGMWVKNSTYFQNVRMVRREKQLGLQTIRPIAKGEEISVAYDPEWRVIQNQSSQSLDISPQKIQDIFLNTKNKFEALRLAEDRLDDPSTKERLRELFKDLGEEALDAIDDLEDFNFEAYKMILADLFVQHELRKLAQKIIGTPEQWRENRKVLLSEDRALAELSKMAGTFDFRFAKYHLEDSEKLRMNTEKLFTRAFPGIRIQSVFDILDFWREIPDRVEKRQRTQSALAKAVQRAKSQSKYRSSPTVFLPPRRSPMGAVKPEIIHYPLSRSSVSITRGISDHLYLSQKDREKLGYLVDHLKDFENRQEVLETLRAVAAANQLAAETDEYPLVSDDPLQTLYETVENPKAWTVYAQVFEDLKNLYPKHQNFLNLMFSALSESDNSSDRERILEILQKKLSSWQALDTDRPQSIQKRQRTRNRIKTCRV